MEVDAGKNLMEDNKLDFNQPLLSVRRHTLTLKSEQRDERKTKISHPVVPQFPQYRSELKSGPIRNPGSVPFLWEQTPGQPKEEAKPHIQDHGQLAVAPMLPPGRFAKANQQECDKLSPSTSGSKNSAVCEPSTSDNKRETSDLHNENVKNVGSSKETADVKQSSDSDDDDTFVDALDTLSRTESTFLNCSMSGINGLDDLQMKPSRSSLTDSQTREFMMDRFLPAAKAMASETPHYAPKRQPLVQEQPKLQNKSLNQYKPTLRYGPSFAKRYSHYHDSEEVEESDDDNDQCERLPAVCGLLPRFCLKGSFGRLNPVLGMSVRTRVPISSSRKLPHRSSPADSYSETDNESRSDITEVKSIEKIETADFDEGKNKLRSTYFDAPLSCLEKKEVLDRPKEHINVNIDDFGLHKTFQDLLTDRDSPTESDSGSSVVEKTLYVDTVQKLESINLRSSLVTPDMKELRSSIEVDHKTVTHQVQDQILASDSATEDFKKLKNVDEKMLLPNADKFDDSSIASSFDKSNGTFRMETEKASTTSRSIEHAKEIEESLEKLQLSYSSLLAPPPLPKSPSDSWLSRTLPSMSKSSYLHSYIGAAKNPQIHGSNGPANDVKWETMVKSTNSQHGHLHHSAGLLTTIPEV